jgi:hypothetical protein
LSASWPGTGDAHFLSPKDADPNLLFSIPDAQASDDEKLLEA